MYVCMLLWKRNRTFPSKRQLFVVSQYVKRERRGLYLVRVGKGESSHKEGESHYHAVLHKERSVAFVPLERIMSITSLQEK